MKRPVRTPMPSGGAVFRHDWFIVVEEAPAGIVRSVRFWDCAGSVRSSTAQDPDYTVGTRLDKPPSARFLVSDVLRGEWNPGEADRIILNTAMRDGRGVTIREEMEPGSAGKAVCVARAKTVAGYDCKGIPANGVGAVSRCRCLGSCVFGPIEGGGLPEAEDERPSRRPRREQRLELPHRQTPVRLPLVAPRRAERRPSLPARPRRVRFA